jgi:hypothetical protein
MRGISSKYGVGGMTQVFTEKKKGKSPREYGIIRNARKKPITEPHKMCQACHS